MSVPTPGSPPGHADVQAAFAATLVDEWVRGGVTHAVVCPGSRSTPLAVALAARPELSVHVRLDERSAAFTALGIGMATGRPAVVLTTSGTAAAELHAAVVEADLAGVPLLACTADRPPDLRDVGAPQTIDQTRLFGSSPRWYSDPGVADAAGRHSWRSLAARSVAEAVSGPAGPGPVHLNLPFREPLFGDPERAGGLSPGRPDGLPWHRAAAGMLRPPADAVGSLVRSGVLAPGVPGVIVAGASCGDPEAVAELSTTLGWPLLADPRSGVRGTGTHVVGAADGLLRSELFAHAHRPHTVLRLGGPWASKVVNGFLASAAEGGARTLVVDPFGRWPDPDRSATEFIRSDPTEFCREVVRTLSAGPGAPAPGADPGGDGRDTGWADGWRQAEAAARAVMDDALGPVPGGPATGRGGLSEPALARRLMACLPPDATLVVSSSMPIRDVEAFGPPRVDHPRVVANRGANGIDGVVSTALGVALASPAPVVALVGDLAFLHDSSALVRAPGFSPHLTVVVADNAGGGIFSFLPAAGALGPPEFDLLFGTPQASDVARVAAGFGWEVDEVGDEPDGPSLEQAVANRVGAGGLGVIRVRLPDRTANVAEHDRVNAAIVRAVDATAGSAG
jgi:2-succinyl-5-enolpyruvyl-6-hydroxy-3-cyclohexene-1-carboxylate synthase